MSKPTRASDMAPLLDMADAQLLLIDEQPSLLPRISEHEIVLAQTERMLRAAGVLDLPVTISEQYPAGLGRTPEHLLALAPGADRLEKTAFSVMRDAAGRDCLLGRGRANVILAGIETHVCVQQTALDLLAVGLHPVVLADAVGSRQPIDRAIALERMRAAGVVVTTVESVIFEMLEQAGTDLFRSMLPIVR